MNKFPLDKKNKRIKLNPKENAINAKDTIEWDRCMFYIEKKKRYCGFERRNGSLYCGNHIQSNNEEDERIPCPIDPTHTITKKSLNKHVLICQRKTENDNLHKQLYYKENLNCGISDDINYEKICLNPSEIPLLISRINELYSIHFPESIKSSISMLDQSLEYKKSFEDIGAQKAVLRHIEQQSSLIYNINSVCKLSQEYLYIEMGAGKGNLSLTLYNTIKGGEYLLIDRANVRHKADTQLRKNNLKFDRIRMDIKDLYLDKCPLVENNNIIIISKHLCGVATDLTLHSIINSKEVLNKTKCIEIALCCHHKCLWKDYVNQDYIKNILKFTIEEFYHLLRLSSWTLLDDKNKTDSSDLDLNEKREIGRKIKRLIDLGRIKYLESNGFKCKLQHYCEISTSPENCMLLAWK